MKNNKHQKQFLLFDFDGTPNFFEGWVRVENKFFSEGQSDESLITGTDNAQGTAEYNAIVQIAKNYSKGPNKTTKNFRRWCFKIGLVPYWVAAPSPAPLPKSKGQQCSYEGNFWARRSRRVMKTIFVPCIFCVATLAAVFGNCDEPTACHLGNDRIKFSKGFALATKEEEEWRKQDWIPCKRMPKEFHAAWPFRAGVEFGRPDMGRDLWARERGVYLHCRGALLSVAFLSDWRKALKDPDSEIRGVTVRKFAEIVPEANCVTPDLMRALNDPDPDVRFAAYDVLTGYRATPEMKKAMSDRQRRIDLAWRVRAYPRSVGKEAVPDLEKVLDYPEYCWVAAAALGGMGPAARDATPRLLDVLRKPVAIQAEGDFQTNRAWPDRQCEISAALRQLGPSILPELRRALQDNNANVRRGAAFALIDAARLGDLRKALDDPSIEIRRAAAETFANMQEPEFERYPRREGHIAAVRELRKALTDADKQVRALAAKSLGRIGQFAKDAAKDLKKAKEDADPSVREAAAQALVEVLRD